MSKTKRCRNILLMTKKILMTSIKVEKIFTKKIFLKNIFSIIMMYFLRKKFLKMPFRREQFLITSFLREQFWENSFQNVLFWESNFQNLWEKKGAIYIKKWWPRIFFLTIPINNRLIVCLKHSPFLRINIRLQALRQACYGNTSA